MSESEKRDPITNVGWSAQELEDADDRREQALREAGFEPVGEPKKEQRPVSALEKDIDPNDPNAEIKRVIANQHKKGRVPPRHWTDRDDDEN